MHTSFIATIAIASIAALSGCSSSPETKSQQNLAEYKRNLELVKAARANGYTVAMRDGQVLFCKKTTPTGSNMPRSECHTSEEWDAIQRHAATAIQQDTEPYKPPPGMR
jgi:hypothetical protein